jgi:hypothetical protein
LKERQAIQIEPPADPNLSAKLGSPHGQKENKTKDKIMKENRRWLRRISGFLHKRVRELRLWDLEDPRAYRGRRWRIETLLSTVLVGLMSGCKGLKDLEALTESLSSPMRKMLGVPRRLPDTTLRQVLCKLQPMQLLELLGRTMRLAYRRKSLRFEVLPFGMVAMDGKGTAIPDYNHEYAQLHHHEGTERTYGLVRTVTTCLANVVGKPCLNAYPIPAATNECGIFAEAFGCITQNFGELFRLVSYDAGAVSKENADLVVETRKDYLFQLTNENQLALKMAKELLGPKQNAVEQTETVLDNHTVVRRKLFIHRVFDWKTNRQNTCHQYFWQHTRTVLRVRSESWVDGTMAASEDRYFVCSMRPHELTAKQWLYAVRAHWSVENQCHGTFDRIFSEDDRPWITGDAQGTLAVMLLRRIAYTLLTLFRSVNLKSDDNRMMPWKELLERIKRALLLATEPDMPSGRRRNGLLVQG